MSAADQNSAVTQGSGEEPIVTMKLLLGYALLFSGLAIFLFAPGGLVLAGLVFVLVGLFIVFKGIKKYGAATHIVSALVPLALLAIVPPAITYPLIKKSAGDIAGDYYCFYQESIAGQPVLTRSVTGLSFVAMLGRGSRIFGPAHAALITKDRLWLWSFQRASFVPWQRIVMDKGGPAFDGRPTMGRPSPDQVRQCFKELNLG